MSSRLSHGASGAVRRFAGWVARGSVDHPLLEGALEGIVVQHLTVARVAEGKPGPADLAHRCRPPHRQAERSRRSFNYPTPDRQYSGRTDMPQSAPIEDPSPALPRSRRCRGVGRQGYSATIPRTSLAGALHHRRQPSRLACSSSSRRSRSLTDAEEPTAASSR